MNFISEFFKKKSELHAITSEKYDFGPFFKNSACKDRKHCGWHYQPIKRSSAYVDTCFSCGGETEMVVGRYNHHGHFIRKESKDNH